VPGVKGTGGDDFFPSETIQSGSYRDGYRGAGNPRQAPTGQGQPQPPYSGTPGIDGQGPGGGAVQRPDSYRSDQALQEMRMLLDAERNKGPSEAEALLHQATDRVAGQALGIAAGARGGAGARARARQQALSANAALGSRATTDVAALRAREENDRRARQANIMGLISGAAQAGDARDLGYTDTETRRQQTETELANTAYQSNANRELQRAVYNASRPTGFLDDPLGGVFSRLFGGPLRSGPTV
jgi:hypothetical protein